MFEIERFKDQFCRRRMALLRDDAADSGRAVLVSPAAGITPELVNAIVELTGGVLFVSMSPERSAGFQLPRMSRPSMVPGEPDPPATQLSCCISVDAREGISTGISAADRARTIDILGSDPSPRRLVKPGHIIPVEARSGGILVRHGLAEGALDLAVAAGFGDAALYVDLLDGAGELLPTEDQDRLAAKRDLPLVTLSDLVRYRLDTEKIVYKVAEAKLPTTSGQFRSCIYKSKLHGGEHLALIKGDISPDKTVLTRVQTEFTAADVFGGSQPPSRAQIEASLRAVNAAGQGVILYLRRPTKGHLIRQLVDWEAEYRGKPASMMREYGLGAQILHDLGVRKIELLSNSAKNLIGLKAFGIEIVSQRELPMEPVPPNR